MLLYDSHILTKHWCTATISSYMNKTVVKHNPNVTVELTGKRKTGSSSQHASGLPVCLKCMSHNFKKKEQQSHSVRKKNACLLDLMLMDMDAPKDYDAAIAGWDYLLDQFPNLWQV